MSFSEQGKSKQIKLQAIPDNQIKINSDIIDISIGNIPLKPNKPILDAANTNKIQISYNLDLQNVDNQGFPITSFQCEIDNGKGSDFVYIVSKDIYNIQKISKVQKILVN